MARKQQKLALETVCLTYTAFDLLRYEKDTVYHSVEDAYQRHFGLDLDISEMDMIPIEILEDGYVVYEITPTEYKVKNNG